MARIAASPLGPFAKWTREFCELSSQAFELLEANWPPLPSSDTALIVDAFSIHAEATSLAARSALTHNYDVASAALLRVRLEQCITQSFLTHAAFEEGWGPYLAHADVQTYRYVRKWKGNASRSLEEAATGARRRFDLRNDRWNQLPLQELARRRDAAAEPHPLSIRLEKEYVEIYPYCSSAIHTSASALPRATTLFAPTVGGDAQYQLLDPSEAQWRAAALAKLDIVQCFDALASEAAAPVSRFVELLDRYNEACSTDS